MLAQARDSRRLAELRKALTPLSGFGSKSTIFLWALAIRFMFLCPGLLRTASTWVCLLCRLAGLTDASTPTITRKLTAPAGSPVNLGQISSGSPLSVLPVDPVNTIASGNYYTYVMGGSYKLTPCLNQQNTLSDEQRRRARCRSLRIRF